MRVSHRQLINSKTPPSDEGGVFLCEKINERNLVNWFLFKNEIHLLSLYRYLSYIDNNILIKCIKNSSLKENEVKIREI